MSDLKFAFDQLAKKPGVIATALLTVALCLGANLAIFAVIESVLRRHLPFPTPDQLMTMFNARADATVEQRRPFTNYLDLWSPHANVPVRGNFQASLACNLQGPLWCEIANRKSKI